MHLTFLYGTAPDYKPAKSFALEGNGIVKKSEYDIGYTFYYNSFPHPDDLPLVTETFKNFASKGWFRIYGAPNPTVFAAPHIPVRRLSENFPEIAGQKFLHFDLDKIVVPPNIIASTKWSLSEPETTAAVIREIFSMLGWQSLAFADFIFLLTSSQFTRERISCHVYFMFEQPKTLEGMRSICLGFNTLKGTKLFDPAPYNPVQPDYIAPPTCINFQDPIPTRARIYYSRGLSAIVPEAMFAKDVATNRPTSWSTSGLVERIGSNWLESIHLYVGTDRGINEPAFRAAAQLVNEVGRSTVLQNIDRFAHEMHDEAWKAILLHGKRGDASDRATYDVARFKQYLESATRQGKGFGTEVDDLMEELRVAIDSAAIGDLTRLTGRTAVSAAKTLEEKYTAAWINAKMMMRKKLRGIITIAEFAKLMKSTSSAQQALVPSTGASCLMETGNENDLIRPILATYEFIQDQDGNLYVASSNGKVIAPIDGDISNTFYRDGLNRSRNAVSILFGKKCSSVLFADLANPISESIAPKQTLVGRRVIPLGDTITKGCWYNAGVQDDGEHKSIHLTASGPVIHSNIDTPRWINAASNILPTDHAFYERFGNDIDPTPQFLLDFYKNNITKYIRCNENDLASLTSWLVTALTNRPLSYIGEFVGPHNCGKSTGADFAKDLIDPSFQALGSGAARSVFAGKVDENFFALLNSQLITIFDNIGVLHPSVQDVLCQVSTGMKYNIRILYKQKQMENFIQRPVILTGLSKLITRPDLMSRAMTINFSEMPQINTRIMEEWYADKPFLFGGLLHLTSLVMKAIERV